MALTKFVKNSTDLSDDGGYKFRFHCDQCGDGFESQYETGSANLLKTAVDVFQMFRPFGGLSRAADGIDRGLRGKEHDAAYEKAVHQAMLFFKKCVACGSWVCPETCWNAAVGMCEKCAPDEAEASAKEAARLRTAKAVQDAADPAALKATPKMMSCPQCGEETGGGKFCAKCGASLISTRKCGDCGNALANDAKFCANCGKKAP